MHNTYIAVVLFATIYVVTTSAIGRSDGRDGGDNRALECEVLDGITGQVMSPGFESGVYPARTRQCWKIIVEESETLNLHFEEFELEDSERCRFDYLKIEPQYDVEDGPEMFSGKLCGQEKPEGPFTYTGSYNEIVLLFYSDAAEELLGFHLIWTISSETQGVDTRLIGGDSNTNIGIVQLNHNGNWLAVSDERFDEREADIACRSIGFTDDKNYAIWDAARAFLDEPPPASVSTLLKVDRCSSSENSLTNCVEEESFTLAGVVCNAEYGGVRLVGGATAGRVEVNIGGVWGSVCDERWGEEDARVVCRELDLEGGNDEDISTYEQGTGVVWYSGVRCRGTEATLSACRMEDRPGENRCAHSRDVAVSCRQPTTPAPTTTPPPTTTAATSQGCTLLRGSGTVETEHPYAVDFTQCWTLYVPDGLVQLTFLSFEVERNSRCGWDSLEIYYGTDIEGEPEHKLCGDADDIASSYRSTGEYMTLNFISDYRDTEEGFVARFSGVDAPSNNGVDCGVPSVTPIDPGSFIVGGHEANPHSHPWIVNFIYDGHVICGGSILSERYVITAAHCVYNENRPDRVMVRVGNHHIDDDEQYEQVYAISDITVHQGWTGSYRRGYDLALLKTEMPIVFNDHVMPVCLPEVEESVEGTVTVSGWGNTEGTGDNDVLNEVFVPVVPHATCSQDTWYGSTLQDNQICAGFERGQRDSCQGDSGGPLTQIADGVTKLYGLTSWGIGCAERRRPGVYTKVADFVDWIEDVTDGDVRPY